MTEDTEIAIEIERLRLKPIGCWLTRVLHPMPSHNYCLPPSLKPQIVYRRYKTY
jgi:hypothetical protein